MKNIKIWAVKQYKKEPVKNIASMLGVSETAIYAWIKLYTGTWKRSIQSKTEKPKTSSASPERSWKRS